LGGGDERMPELSARPSDAAVLDGSAIDLVRLSDVVAIAGRTAGDELEEANWGFWGAL